MQQIARNVDTTQVSLGSRLPEVAPMPTMEPYQYPPKTATPRALVIDSQLSRRSRIRRRLEHEGFTVAEAQDGLVAWELLRRRQPDLVVCCLQSRGLDGIELLQRIRRSFALPVLLHTTTPDVAAAVDATRLGARDVLLLPKGLDRLAEHAREIVEHDILDDLEGLVIGKNARIQCARERVLALATLKVPVLVCGETGTGRDHIIHALHALSKNRDERLIVVRDSESFAPQNSKSVGVVYLNDLESFTCEAQSYWLEKIEASQHGKGLARIYASTTENLQTLSRDGKFDAELATRISRFRIDLPPLRERIDDLADLARVLVAKSGAAMNRDAVHLTTPAIAELRQHTWPGNLRELSTVMEKLVAFSRSGRITRRDVQVILKEDSESVAALRLQQKVEQRQELISLLRQTGGNLAETARRMNMSRGAVIYRARKFGLLARRWSKR